MTAPRSDTVNDLEEGIYHCISRCVRRAYLCGEDPLTGKNFDHRKEWVRNRLKLLCKVFAIEVLSYALMTNHQHTLIRTLPDLVTEMSDEDVATRWLTLYPKRRDKQGRAKAPSDKEINEITIDKELLKKLRLRLSSVSWFMKCLNEHIARRANREDECKGHFWDGRFKCKRVEDNAGVLACSVYIDLNPIRAGIAKTPEASDFTSCQERILSIKGRKDDRVKRSEPKLWIAPVYGDKTRRGFLPLSLEEYLTVVDKTGRMVQAGKAGVIPEGLPPILERLGINTSCWKKLATDCSRIFSNVIGPPDLMDQAASKTNRAWIKGMPFSRLAFA